MEFQRLLNTLKKDEQAEIIVLISNMLRERGIFACGTCLMPLYSENIFQCYPCMVEECGCKGDLSCCGYDPRDR